MDDMLGSDDEDKHDAYLERMKREGEEVDSDDDDSDSSEGIYFMEYFLREVVIVTSWKLCIRGI